MFPSHTSRFPSNPTGPQDKTISELNELLQNIEANNFHRAQIHCFFLLAICNLLKNDEKATLLAKEYVEKAINLSTSYGILFDMLRLLIDCHSTYLLTLLTGYYMSGISLIN